MLNDGKIDQGVYDAAVAEEIALNLAPENTKLRNNYVDTYTYNCATKAFMKNAGFEFRNNFSSDEEEKAYDKEYDDLTLSALYQILTKNVTLKENEKIKTMATN